MQIPADDPKRKGKWDDAYGSGVVIASGAWGSRIFTDAHVVADARDLRATIRRCAAAPFRCASIARSNDDDDLAMLDVATPGLPAVTLGAESRSSSRVARSACSAIRSPMRSRTSTSRNVVSLYTGRIASVRGASGTIEIDVPGDSR